MMFESLLGTKEKGGGGYKLSHSKDRRDRGFICELGRRLKSELGRR